MATEFYDSEIWSAKVEWKGVP